MAVGGISESTPRLHITTSLEQCKAGAIDSVYTSGPLLSNGDVYFDIDALEAWAVSPSEEHHVKSLQLGQVHATRREEARIKAAQVDRKQFLEDFQSGQFVNSLYQHREQARGRHSFCADDEEGRGYYIDEKTPTPKRDNTNME